MEISKNLQMNLPSRDGDDMCDVNVLSDDLRIIDEAVGEINANIKTKAEKEYVEETFEKKENKSTSMDMQSNVDYPTTKAVADFVKEKTDVLSNALYGLKKSNSTEFYVAKINDISPLCDNLDVELVADGITDFSDVNVIACGKNLFADFITSATYGDSTITTNSDGSVTLNLVAGQTISQSYILGTVPPGTYTISTGLDRGLQPRLLCEFRRYDATKDEWVYVKEIRTSDASVSTATIDTYCRATLKLYGTPTTTEKVTIYPQLEYNNEATKYEKFVELYNGEAPENGKLSIPSHYPNAIIFTDTDGVFLNVRYKKDVNKLITYITEDTYIQDLDDGLYYLPNTNNTDKQDYTYLYIGDTGEFFEEGLILVHRITDFGVIEYIILGRNWTENFGIFGGEITQQGDGTWDGTYSLIELSNNKTDRVNDVVLQDSYRFYPSVRCMQNYVESELDNLFTSPDGSKWKIKVDNNGNITTEKQS